MRLSPIPRSAAKPTSLDQEDVIARVQSLFKDDMDLMKGFYHFLPDRDTQERMAAHLDEMEETRIHATETRGGRRKAGDAAAATKGAAGATVPQKRKRKPAERDKAEPDREKHKEIAPKPGPSKVRVYPCRLQGVVLIFMTAGKTTACC